MLNSDDQIAKKSLTQQPDILFTINQSKDCSQFAHGAGDRLETGTISLNDGFVRLRFDHGVEVTLQGPAEFEVMSLETTHLHSGLMTAHVPKGSEGFTVFTPQADVVDLGTSFGIDLQEDGETHVSVFEGEVEVAPSEDTGATKPG